MSTQDISRFAWLADSPLFIDSVQLERFYDAVVRPTYVEGATSVTFGSSGEITVGGGVTGGGKLSIGGGFLKLLTGGSGEVSGEAKATGEAKGGKSKSQETQWLPVRTSQRQLEQLVLSYDSLVRERLMEFGPSSTAAKLFDPETAAKRPRALVVLDLPGREQAKQLGVQETKFFPMAVELTNGRIRLLYNELREVQVGKLTGELAKGEISKLDQMLQDLRSAPASPDSSAAPANPGKLSVAQTEQKKWEQFAPYFDPWDAMKIVEDGVGEHRIRWIDFQISCALEKGRKFHLHICPEGDFDTGVFAYNLVFRAFQHGIRLVGTLKSGPDINVLAIYDK